MDTIKQKTQPTSKKNSGSNLPAKIDDAAIAVQNLLSLYESKNKVAIIRQASEISSMEKVLQMPGRSQISACRKHNEEGLEKLLKHMLVDLSKSFTITNNLKSDQILEIVAEMMYNWWWLTLEDLQLFFRKIKMGEYGIVYGLDTNKILTWLGDYDSKRLNLIHSIRKDEQYELSGPPMERVSEVARLQDQIGKTRALIAIAKPKGKKTKTNNNKK